MLSDLSLRRIKLFQTLEVEPSSEHSLSICCSEDLSEDELDILDACLSNCNEINETESSTLYYISGYVTFKEKLCCDQPAELPHCSEFTNTVSSGKLPHPPIKVCAKIVACAT